jgi:hypothetical protein
MAAIAALLCKILKNPDKKGKINKERFMNDQPVLFNHVSEDTSADKAVIIQNALIVLKQDQEKRASTGYVANILNKLDPALAKITGEITQKAIQESSGLSSQQEHQLRVNILINAFERLNNLNNDDKVERNR